MNDIIPVSSPLLNGNEKKYVIDCLDSSWISSNGKYISLFEESFSRFLGINNSISCCNGTVALHLALLALDVREGDEIIVPTLTYVATANAVTYCGAKPIFIDSENNTWNLDPNQIEKVLTSKTKGIIVVHIYGHPANMDPIIEIAKRRGLFIIEDCAEAHGAEYKGAKVGTFSTISTFSFYGNKIVTSGEGGMVCTNNDKLANKIRQIKGQGQDPLRKFWHPIIGYNYRMTNIEAAIGLAQMERVEWHVNQRKIIAKLYRNFLEECQFIEIFPEMPWAKSVFWLVSVLIPQSVNRDEIIQLMMDKGVETRPFFSPMHLLPPYINDNNLDFPIALDLSQRGLNLPTFGGITQNQILRVVQTLKESIEIASSH